MAARIKIIHQLRAQIDPARTTQTPELVRQMADRTNLNNSLIRFIVLELSEALLRSHRMGRAVKVDGLGTFTPTLRGGKLDIVFRAEPALKRELNDPERFVGTLLNKENLGKSAQELVEQWNAAHPDDPVEQ
jgi:nucleoid DNA-binding protein